MKSVESREIRLRKTTISSVICQITAIVCGFILPRMIIGTYGSMQNGMVQSIAQFLSVITFLDLGVGSVVQSALYKPLAVGDSNELSRIIVSAQRFFRTIAIILGAYIIVLTFTYPLFSGQDIGYFSTAALVFVIGYGLFAQYYFGMVNSLLITADQKGYIPSNLSIITLALNTIVSIILIKRGVSLLVLKSVVSVIFLIKPVYLTFYVKQHYQIDYTIRLDTEPIKQKWNGIAMHISSVVLDNTDVIVLTVFSTLSNVSVYAVYNMILIGLKQLLLSATTGVRALIGNLISTGETEKLTQLFSWFDWIVHTGSMLIFSITSVLILPFVSVYTNGITDAEYVQPVFALLIVAAHTLHCLRIPYNSLILAAGHYKQTQSVFTVAALLNIVLSIFAVCRWGLIGVAIGTLVSMIYQTVWMAWYTSRNLISWPASNFIKQISVDALTIVLTGISSKLLQIQLETISFYSWIIMAIKVSVMVISIVLIVNMFFYRTKVLSLVSKLGLCH